MEADIIVEGFCQSIPMYNSIYDKVTGDSDFSVTKRSNLAKPFGRDVCIQKNRMHESHILRNYINRIVDILSRRKSFFGTVVPGFHRKVIKDKRFKFRWMNITIYSKFNKY